MIVTVTLNAALDVTYRLGRLRPGATNRIASISERAGGKGVNVARVLAALGQRVLVSGLVGGVTGTQLRADLDRSGLPYLLTPLRGTTRRTVAVVAEDTDEVTGLWEPGPRVTADEWTRFTDRDLPAAISGADAVVLAGSLPPGVPTDAYAVLLRCAAECGVPALLDADGEALRAGLAVGPGCGPALVKPNVDEAERATGAADPADAAKLLCELGAGVAVVTAGADGLFGSTAEGFAWHTPAPRRVRGNATGAGDAASAALVGALVAGRPWPEATADAAALAAAAVAAPLAGEYDPDLYAELTRPHPTPGRSVPRPEET